MTQQVARYRTRNRIKAAAPSLFDKVCSLRLNARDRYLELDWALESTSEHAAYGSTAWLDSDT